VLSTSEAVSSPIIRAGLSRDAEGMVVQEPSPESASDAVPSQPSGGEDLKSVSAEPSLLLPAADLPPIDVLSTSEAVSSPIIRAGLSRDAEEMVVQEPEAESAIDAVPNQPSGGEELKSVSVGNADGGHVSGSVLSQLRQSAALDGHSVVLETPVQNLAGRLEDGASYLAETESEFGTSTAASTSGFDTTSEHVQDLGPIDLILSTWAKRRKFAHSIVCLGLYADADDWYVVGEGSEWCIQFYEIETSPEDSTLTPALFHQLTGIKLRGHIIDLPAETLDGLSVSIVLGDIKPLVGTRLPDDRELVKFPWKQLRSRPEIWEPNVGEMITEQFMDCIRVQCKGTPHSTDSGVAGFDPDDPDQPARLHQRASAFKCWYRIGFKHYMYYSTYSALIEILPLVWHRDLLGYVTSPFDAKRLFGEHMAFAVVSNRICDAADSLYQASGQVTETSSIMDTASLIDSIQQGRTGRTIQDEERSIIVQAA
jgi:hypothetical protein